MTTMWGFLIIVSDILVNSLCHGPYRDFGQIGAGLIWAVYVRSRPGWYTTL